MTIVFFFIFFLDKGASLATDPHEPLDNKVNSRKMQVAVFAFAAIVNI